MKFNSIKHKMLAGSIVFVLFLAVYVGITINSFKNISEKDAELDSISTAAQSAQEMRGYLQQQLLIEYEYITTKDPKLIYEYQDTGKKMDEHRNKMVELGGSFIDPSILNTLKQRDAEFDAKIDNNFFENLSKPNNGEYHKNFVTAITGIMESAYGIEEALHEKYNSIREEVDDYQKKVKTILLVIGIAMIGLLLAASIYFANSLTKPISALAAAAQTIAQGQLHVRVPVVKTGDEVARLADSFSEMVENLRRLISGMQASAEQVAATAEELNASSEAGAAASNQVAVAISQLVAANNEQCDIAGTAADMMERLNNAIGQIASAARDQAQNVNQMAEIVNQMVKGVDDVTQSTTGVARVSGQTAQVAEDGGKAVEETIKGMHRIRSTVLDSAERIRELGEHSEQIGQIIQVIDDIAEQTNLLALNAAIEAARAGEHGKGFAVVADEVRKLAERSGKATKEIAGLINTIQRGTASAVQSMENGTQEVEKGVQLADSAEMALRNIINMVEQANGQIQTVMAAIEEISASTGEVLRAVDNVAAITEENSAAAEEMAASSTGVRDAIGRVLGSCDISTGSTQEISSSSEELSATAEQIANAAQSLADMAGELQVLTARFKL